MISKKVAGFIPPLIFFLPFSLYLFTALPSTYWRDTPEFQTIGFLLDIAHPAGSPFYALIVKLFTYIPIGSISFKTTLVSAVFGGGISVSLYLCLRFLLLMLFENGQSSAATAPSSVIALFSTLVFSFSNALWENSNATEVYTLQNFFTLFFILILLKTHLLLKNHTNPGQHVFALLLTLSFLFGLGLGAHAILILYLPCLFFLIYFIWIKRFSLNIIKTYSLLFFFFLLGFSIYLYLPVRSTQNPLYDWGNPETLSNFFVHITDRKDASFHFSLPVPIMPQLKHFMDLLVENFSWLGLLISGLGLCYLFSRKEMKLLIVFGIFSLPPFVFFIRYWRWHSAYIPTFLILTFFLSIGLYFIRNKTSEWQTKHCYHPSYNTALFTLLGIQLFSLFSSHVFDNLKNDYWAAHDIYKSVLNDVPPNSIVFMENTVFGMNYTQQVSGMRPDVTLMSVADVLEPSIYSTITQERYPNVIIPKTTPGRLGPEIIEKNILSHPIYWEPGVRNSQLVTRKLIPEGFLFRVSASEIEIDLETNERSQRKFVQQIASHATFLDFEEKTFYWGILNGRGRYYFDLQYFGLALAYFEVANTIIQDDLWSLKMIGAAHLNLNHPEKAERILLHALSINDKDSEVYRDLGSIYLFKKDVEKAEQYFWTAIRMNKTDLVSNYSLGEIKEKQGETAQALSYYRNVYKNDPDFREIRTIMNRLKQGM